MKDPQNAAIIPIRVAKSTLPTDCRHAQFPSISESGISSEGAKASVVSSLPRAVGEKTPASTVKLPAQVQLVEKSPGVYDITVICGCGETIVVRCESLQKSPSPEPEPAPALVSPDAKA